MSLATVASVVSGGLNHYPTVFYDKVAVETLRSNLFFYQALEQKPMPDKSGVAMQIFGYSKMSANTVSPTEGTPGSGQALTDGTRTITLSQFVDYVSFSDKVVQTDISNTVADGAKELAYRGALSVDKVCSNQVDVDANGDSATRIEIADGSYMTAAKAREAVWSLRALDVKPKANGLFFGIIHSLVTFDLINDSTTGGFQDLQKYADSTAPKNPALVGIQGTRVGNVGGVEWYESNAVPSESNWQSSANTAYHSYVFGKDAYFGSSLGRTELGQKNFSVKVSTFDTPNTFDPANVIRAAAAYNFWFGLSKTPLSTNKFRRIRSESSIA